ncbi:acetyltransferase [Moritella sp. Urea-trap-13]|uniref:acetyltransferase n=1 Tax=Moritella sp. Urea-trap-13 TaxID=2058327 RepID=UPI000C33E5A4|nr:acetyltransferase [Moritella sp. Urea-trap-13]PKH05304.1 acetyltransferase [Moritella sp. Urea-trap-13]
MKELVIIGGGGFAKEIVWLARDCGRVIKGVLDDNLDIQGSLIAGVPIIGVVDDWHNFSACEFVIAIGSPRTRRSVVNKMKLKGTPTFTKLIHPSVRMSEYVDIGEGAMICAGSILTVDISIGKHCILNLNVTVGHECCFDDFVTVAPMAAVSGNVRLHNCVEIGTGAVLRQGLTLEQGSMLGMGAVLTKNIAENYIFAGNPARKLKELPGV